MRPFLVFALLLACAVVHPAELDTGGGGGDSIRWKTFQMLAAGDLEGAGEYYLLATGATQLPRWFEALQGAFSVANRVAGPCQKVADDIFEGFKRLEQSPAMVTFTTNATSGNAARMGFMLSDGRVAQVSVSGYHVAVRCGERIFDAFTGPTGMLVAEYMQHLIPGMESFPVVMK